jgi:sugar phosphate isomerase/epimerase
MLLGAADFHVGDWRRIPPDVIARAAALGFGTLNVRVADPGAASAEDIHRTRQLFADHGMVVGQTVGEYGGDLVSPDTSRREATIAFVERMCDLTSRLGAPNTYLRPGSLNPAGAWTPHPGNRSSVVFDRLVDSTRRICRTAGSLGVQVAVEAGVVSPLYSPARVKEFLDAVGSNALGFNQDPVNLVGTLEDAWDPTRLVNECFDVLGTRTIGAHVKDVRLVDGLLPVFEEAEIGTGLMDHVTFLRRLQAEAPDAHVLIEHLPQDRFPAAVRALTACAADAGVSWHRPGQ